MHSNVSSPILKARKYQGRFTNRRILVCLMIFSCLLLLFILPYFGERLRLGNHLSTVEQPENLDHTLYELSFWPTNPPHPGIINAHRPHASILHSSKALDLLGLPKAEPIQARSLTALLPVNSRSISNLQAIVSSLLKSPGQLHEVIISCPEAILSDVRRIIQKHISAEGSEDTLEFSLRPWGHERDSNMAIMHVASEVTTDWVVFLDDSGLHNMDNDTQNILLNPTTIPLPAGPRGFASLSTNTTCMPSSVDLQLASFVIPPFVMPYSLVTDGSATSTGLGIWVDLGERISQETGGIGGIVVGADATSDWCHFVQSNVTFWDRTNPVPNLPTEPDITELGNEDSSSHSSASAEIKDMGTFAMLFPSLRVMRQFSSVACRLQSNGYLVNVLLYGAIGYADEPLDEPTNWKERTSGCRLNYDTLSPEDVLPAEHRIFGISFVSDWLDTFDEWPEVVVAIKDQDSLSGLPTVLEQSRSVRPSLILIPYMDLPYCGWMGSLSVQEWKNWNVPRVDVSVITKDRPKSLARLLTSLSSAKFFGDSLVFRINLEQTSDTQTMQLVERFRWNHGISIVHHRVIHGGLLPAVVESWYPHSNDSYGLLLEDDVELSPMFYAWVKMTILRYRYGANINKSPQLFGISLYQQKNIELKLQGRRPFDARAIFYDHSLPHPNTPYLSQIPCSWGAVYFPEHWREFHEYLAVRFSEHSFSIDEDVVPDVRSNRWSKSWKKYFIELVYLRGYAMLYPNYADFVSFSTNHLEVGSHVKDRPNDVYLQRKELFLLPLMPLSDDTNSSIPPSQILDLPDETLPLLHSLPILNLTGSLTSFATLIDQGRTRRTQLTRCPVPPSIEYDVRDLLCITSPL